MKRASMEITVTEDGGHTRLFITRPGSQPRRELGKIDQGSTPFEPAVLDELRQLFRVLQRT